MISFLFFFLTKIQNSIRQNASFSHQPLKVIFCALNLSLRDPLLHPQPHFRPCFRFSPPVHRMDYYYFPFRFANHRYSDKYTDRDRSISRKKNQRIVLEMSTVSERFTDSLPLMDPTCDVSYGSVEQGNNERSSETGSADLSEKRTTQVLQALQLLGFVTEERSRKFGRLFIM